MNGNVVNPIIIISIFMGAMFAQQVRLWHWVSDINHYLLQEISLLILITYCLFVVHLYNSNVSVYCCHKLQLCGLLLWTSWSSLFPHCCHCSCGPSGNDHPTVWPMMALLSITIPYYPSGYSTRFHIFLVDIPY